mmetsp:Transcript_47936/g.129274  ORF Transcript_47936/g.129274 Transcript_47936/m.129274 type:complete len:85 (-) Transcript_47936:206-460(-)
MLRIMQLLIQHLLTLQILILQLLVLQLLILNTRKKRNRTQHTIWRLHRIWRISNRIRRESFPTISWPIGFSDSVERLSHHTQSL